MQDRVESEPPIGCPGIEIAQGSVLREVKPFSDKDLNPSIDLPQCLVVSHSQTELVVDLGDHDRS